MWAGRRQTVTIEDDMDGDRELEDFEDEARTIEVGNESDDCERASDIDDDDETTELPPVSHKVRSYRKRSRARSKTIALKRLTRAELALGTAMFPPLDDAGRPRTRGECSEAERPCPWVACKHHLYLDINPRTGSIKLNFPDLEPWELAQTCALDVAEAGGRTLEEIGEITNLTRERVRQVEVRGLLALHARAGVNGLR
jgi:hypothetical protein